MYKMNICVLKRRENVVYSTFKMCDGNWCLWSSFFSPFISALHRLACESGGCSNWGRWGGRQQLSLHPRSGQTVRSLWNPWAPWNPVCKPLVYMISKWSGNSKILNFLKGLVRKDIILNLLNFVKSAFQAWLLEVELWGERNLQRQQPVSQQKNGKKLTVI